MNMKINKYIARIINSYICNEKNFKNMDFETNNNNNLN